MAMRDLFVPKAKSRASTNGKITAVYSYRDAQDVERFQVVRYASKKFLQRRPDGRGGWVWNLQGVEPILYRLPELLAAPGRDVVVVEGEKDVDRLARVGILATTNPMGAGKWRSILYNPPLAGRRVVVIPDRDRPGWDHALSIAESLRSTADVRILELPDLPRAATCRTGSASATRSTISARS